MEIINKKIKNKIVNKVLIETDRKSLKWCNQYRLVPKSNRDYQLVGTGYERGEPIYEGNSLQNGRYSNFRTTFNEEQLRDLKEAMFWYIPQCRIYWEYSIRVDYTNAFRPDGCSKSVYSDNEGSYLHHQRNLKSLLYDISR
jgi:hypothetical protein